MPACAAACTQQQSRLGALMQQYVCRSCAGIQRAEPASTSEVPAPDLAAAGEYFWALLCGDQGVLKLARSLRRKNPQKYGWIVDGNGRLHKHVRVRKLCCGPGCWTLVCCLQIYYIRTQAEYVQFGLGRYVAEELGFSKPTQMKILLGIGYMAERALMHSVACARM